MTGIDTAALRALAAQRSVYAGVLSLWPPVSPDDLRALCDGYDEAARLRAKVAHIEAIGPEHDLLACSRYIADATDFLRDVRAERDAAQAEAARLRDEVEVSDGLTRTVIAAREHSERVLTAERDAARQALVALVADLRALCDEWDALGDDWTPVVVRAVIDRHAPEGGR